MDSRILRSGLGRTCERGRASGPGLVSRSSTPRRRSRVSAFGLCVALPVAVIVSLGGSVRVAATEAEPTVDSSFYVNTTVEDTLFNLGCTQAHTDTSKNVNSQVVLDFGGQEENGIDLTDSETGTTFTNGDAVLLTEDFANGYWDCAPVGGTTQLRLAIGTCNCVWVSETLGTTFGGMVQTVSNDVFSSGWESQVTIWGANDIESWPNGKGGAASGTDAEAWEAGYVAGTGNAYLDYGSLNGCPPSGSCCPYTTNCWGWSQAVYYALSWGDTAAFPLPEIYTQATINEWINMDTTKGSSEMEFTGPLDDHDLSSGHLDSSDAWTKFYSALVGCCYSEMPYQDEIHVG
jgi:hypothetical protein